MSMTLDEQFTLEIFKARDVKTPVKAPGSAGWDFFVPENLNMKDFTKNIAIYVNENLVNKKDVKSPTFYIKNKKDGRELAIKFYKDPETGNICYWNCNSAKTIIPEYNEWIENPDTIVTSIDLEVGEKILIPSGIHVKLPKNVFLNAENKSGIASKRALIKGACVTGDTLIETNKGKFTAETLTKEFCDKNNILIKSYNEFTKEYEFQKCDGFKQTNKTDTIKVTFDDNSIINGTLDHCIFIHDKWNSLENL